MSGYDALASSYDGLMADGAYRRRADFLERLFRKGGIPVHSVLDLACGTGTIACLLAERGYRVTATDGSEEMLTQAMAKASCLEGEPPLFLHQAMPRLRLIQPVDAAVSTLDSLNYLTRKQELQETFRRVYRWLKPGGQFIFDVNTPYKLRRMDGQMYMDETEESFCVWRTFFSERTKVCTYQVDLFQLRSNSAWERDFEEHRERAWEAEELQQYLAEAGFTRVSITGDLSVRPPAADEDRWIVRCVRELESIKGVLSYERSAGTGNYKGRHGEGRGGLYPGLDGAGAADPQDPAGGYSGPWPDPGGGLHDGQCPEGGRSQSDSAHPGRRPIGYPFGGVG